MKSSPIYENLDTSFVNLAALVRYLRGRQFSGNVRVELGGYEAEIFLTADGKSKTREHDRFSGRIAEGEEALQRLLIRAREPGGIIHVYPAAMKSANGVKAEKTTIAAPPLIVENKALSLEIPNINSTSFETARQIKSSSALRQFAENEKAENAATIRRQIIPEAKPILKSTEFPFEFSNNVESKARQNQISETDWQMLLSLTNEILRTIDESLARNNLNFAAAFQKACAEMSSDYPFLNPNAGILAYKNGEIEMREQMNAKLFAAAINETLRRILEKLAASPKFAEVYRATTQNLLALINNQKLLCDKFFITPQLEKILGA
ncbi:MAG: hypothetical protein M3Q99_04380 [Acidobacteriota bacterium]|nr:hypothetical protein [Acidobacteriota bacterium]